MSDKRKICQISPEENKNTLCNIRKTPKFNKEVQNMTSIKEADFKKIKNIIDNSLEVALANMATKDDIINLNKEIDNLRKENQELSKKLHSFELRCCLLEEELEIQSREIKNKNLIFTLPSDCEDPQERINTVTKLLLGNEAPDMPPAIKLIQNNKTIKMKLNTGSNENTTKMLENAPKLKGTGVYIQRDRSKQSQFKHRIILAYRKSIKESKPTEVILIKNNTMIVDKKIFYLSKNNTLKYQNEDGETELQKMFGDLNFSNVTAVYDNIMFDKRQNEWSRPITPTPEVSHANQRITRSQRT